MLITIMKRRGYLRLHKKKNSGRFPIGDTYAIENQKLCSKDYSSHDLFLMGSNYLEEGKLKLAEFAFSYSHGKNPLVEDNLRKLGLTYFLQGEYSKVIEINDKISLLKRFQLIYS